MPNPYNFPKVKELSNSEKENIKEIGETLEPIAKPIAKKILSSLIRHGLTLGAGYLVARGLMDQDQTANIIGLSPQLTDLAMSLILYLIGQGMSIKEKVKKSA